MRVFIGRFAKTINHTCSIYPACENDISQLAQHQVILQNDDSKIRLSKTDLL